MEKNADLQPSKEITEKQKSENENEHDGDETTMT
jgi:hypothetical protein